MAQQFIPSPIFSMTPTERALIAERLKQNPVYDPEIRDITESFGGRFLLGARNTLTGAVGWGLGASTAGLLNDDPGDPLNLKKRRNEVDPLRDPLSYTLGNNPEAIAGDLEGVPFDEWAYIVSAPTYGEYQNRLSFIKAGLPVGQQEGSGWGFAFGLAGDFAALTAVGLAAEPLALAGLGARTTLAGRAANVSVGALRSQSLAAAATEAAATVGRMNLTARYAVLGVAEEAVYQAVRNGVDPLYDPEVSDVMFDLTLSGGFAGLIGGAAFGRAFVRENIIEAAKEMRSQRLTTLPGGYTISYGPRVAFDSPAAADEMLFRAGTGSFDFEAQRVADDLWKDWERNPVVPDFAIPGTRTMELGVIQEGAPMARVDVPADVAATTGRRFALVPTQPAAGEWVTTGVGTQSWIPTTPQGARRQFPKAGPVVSARSAIKAVAFEISLAGGTLTRETFAMVAKALVNVERRGLKSGAFNKALWEEVSAAVGPDVAAKLRKDKAFVGGIDRTVVDIVERETMVDTIWSMYRRNVVNGVDTRDSLIFRVLSEIRSRGGTVNRNVVASVIDGLREVAQNPPKRASKGGRQVIDKNQRRAEVGRIINRYAAEDRQLTIPDSVLNKMKPMRGGGAAAGGGAGGLGGSGTGLDPSDPNFGDLPQVKRWWERIPFLSPLLNQSARLMESDNGAARLVGYLAFGAKRSFEIAQPQTIMEAGSMMLHGLMFTFLRGYRQGLTQFVLGNDATVATLGDRLRLIGNKTKRQEFNRRVIQQLRTGAFDDASAAINETAQGFRKMLNEIHELAHSVGLKGFQTTAVNNYMPRLWRFDLIRRLTTTENGRKALKDLIKKAIDQNGRRVVVDGVEQTLKGDIDEAATVFTNRLIGIAKQTENAPLIEQEQELADALQSLLAPVKGKGPAGGTPFGRARTLLDETAGVSTAEDLLGNGKRELTIADLTNDDLPFVMRKYISSIMGAVNQRRMINAFNDEMRARGVFGPKFVTKTGETIQDQVEVETVDEMMNLVNKLGEPMSAGQREAFEELMAAIRYEPIHKGMMNIPSRLLGLSLNYGYLTTGGQFGLAAMGELSRIVGTLGLAKTIRQMPVLLEMVQNYRNLDRDTQNFASLLDAWFAPSTDRMRRVFMEITPTEEYSGILGKVERGLNSASQVLSDISLLAPVTSFTQQLTAAVSMQHLYDVAIRGTKRLDNATVRALGLEPEQYEQIIKFVGANAETRAGFMGDRIVGMKNIDAKEMQLIKGFVQRMVESRIQSVPTRGDFHKSAFTMLGRVLTQFRTFNLKGIDNFLIQNATRVGRGGAAKVAQEISATLLFAGLIQYGRNYADWRSQTAARDWKAADETEQRLGLAGFVRGAFTGPAEFFVPAMLTDFVSNFAFGDPVFSPYRYSGLQTFGFPGEAQTQRLGGLLKDVYGATVGKAADLKTERDVTTSTIRKARLLLPGQNLPILKQYFNILESEIEEEYSLRSRQPRRRKEPD